MKRIRAVVAAVVALLVGVIVGWVVRGPAVDDAQGFDIGGYRYVESVSTYIEEDGESEERSEQWMRADMNDCFRIVQHGSESSGEYCGFHGGLRPPLQELPAEPAALRSLLLEAVEDQRWGLITAGWAPGHPTPEDLEQAFTAGVVGLLADADVTSEQRRALFDALKLVGGAEPLPSVADGLGRIGEGVRVPVAFPGDDVGEYIVSFDAERGEVLMWAFTLATAEGGRAEMHTLVATGHVDELGERP